jgi:hypothetical protein
LFPRPRCPAVVPHAAFDPVDIVGSVVAVFAIVETLITRVTFFAAVVAALGAVVAFAGAIPAFVGAVVAFGGAVVAFFAAVAALMLAVVAVLVFNAGAALGSGCFKRVSTKGRGKNCKSSFSIIRCLN